MAEFFFVCVQGIKLGTLSLRGRSQNHWAESPAPDRVLRLCYNLSSWFLLQTHIAVCLPRTIIILSLSLDLLPLKRELAIGIWGVHMDWQVLFLNLSYSALWGRSRPLCLRRRRTSSLRRRATRMPKHGARQGWQLNGSTQESVSRFPRGGEALRILSGGNVFGFVCFSCSTGNWTQDLEFVRQAQCHGAKSLAWDNDFEKEMNWIEI